MAQTIAVIDYNMGNLHSVSKAIEHVAEDAQVWVTDDPQKIATADRVIFPGQGAARDCMAAISKHHLNQVIRDAAQDKPFLGICMGLQVLLEHSEENAGTELLGLLPGEVKRILVPEHAEHELPLKIPHMGWSRVQQQLEHPLWDGIVDGERFYFVHSYRVVPNDHSVIAATTEYGSPYCCAIAQNNVFAVQFHPEKSADAGLRLLRNFVNWQP